MPISQATRTKMRSARGSAKQKEPVGKKVIGIMLWLRMRNETCNDVMRKEGEMVVILMGLFKRQFINHIRFFCLFYISLTFHILLWFLESILLCIYYGQHQYLFVSSECQILHFVAGNFQVKNIYQWWMSGN